MPKPKSKITMKYRARYNAYVKKQLRKGEDPIDIDKWLQIHADYNKKKKKKED